MKHCSKFTLLALLGLVALPMMAQEAATAPAPEEEVAVEEDEGGWVFGGTVGIDYCSKQLTYGLIDNPHGIVTPSVELSFGNDDFFTIAIGAEAIFDTTNYGALSKGETSGGYNDRRYKYQELALGVTISRAWDTTESIGSSIETALNYTYEYHPGSTKNGEARIAADGCSANPNTQWLNFEVSAPDYWLVPTFTLEYQLAEQGGDNTGKGGIYATFSVAHSFDLGASIGLDEEVLTLTPTVGLGMGTSKRNRADFGDYYDEYGKSGDSLMMRDGFVNLELAYSPFEGFSIAPYVGIEQQLDSVAKDAAGDDDFVAFAGIGVSYEF